MLLARRIVCTPVCLRLLLLLSGPAPPLPMFTSCCPAWVNLVETDYPELIPHLSSCKSPQQMMGAVVKEVWCRQMGLKVRGRGGMGCVGVSGSR